MKIPYARDSYSTFDGRSFESMGIVIERVHDDLPSVSEETESRVGADGNRILNLSLAPKEITLECRAFEGRWQDFEELKDALASWLLTNDERTLTLRTHPGQRYKAHYSSFTEGERKGGTGIGGFEITFVASDPIRYGESRALVVKSGGSGTLTIAGTRNADMVITTNAASRDSNGVWGMTVDGKRMLVPISSSGQKPVRIDCVSHTVTVAGQSAMLTLQSDWPRFNPGSHRVTMTNGTGAATFSWVQRYA